MYLSERSTHHTHKHTHKHVQTKSEAEAGLCISPSRAAQVGDRAGRRGEAGAHLELSREAASAQRSGGVRAVPACGWTSAANQAKQLARRLLAVFPHTAPCLNATSFRTQRQPDSSNLAAALSPRTETFEAARWTGPPQPAAAQTRAPLC